MSCRHDLEPTLTVTSIMIAHDPRYACMLCELEALRIDRDLLKAANARLQAFTSELIHIAWHRGRGEFPPADSDRLADIGRELIGDEL